MITLKKKPFQWFSAHREAKFTFDFESIELDGTLAWLLEDIDTSKMCLVYTGTVFSETPLVGDFIYVDSGEYKGYHLITDFDTVTGFFKVLTDTDYTIDQTAGNVKNITSHVFEIYSGYSTGDLATLLPYTQIAEFRSEANVDGFLEVNISGYVNKIFDVINSNDTVTVGAVEVYYNTFNRITVLMDGFIFSTHYALNSAIDQFELNRDYVGTGRSLNSGGLGNHYFDCGESVLMFIDGSHVVAGATYSGGSSNALPDFLSGDFLTGDFSTSI